MVSSPNLVMREGGLQKGFSNIVGSLMAAPYTWLSVDYRFSFDKETLRTQFSELTGYLGTDLLRLNVGYTKLASLSSPAYLGKQEALEASLSSHFHENWGTKLESHYNLSRKRLLNIGVHLIYQNDCFKASIKLGKTRYHSKDIQPANHFSFSFGLKNLGSRFSSISNALKATHNPVVNAFSSSQNYERHNTYTKLAQ